MGILFTVGVFIIVLGIMILVHEFGHYITAKKLNVKVLEFSLGMGPKIYGFRRGETEYMLKLFPIGGSVKMLGEEPGETDEEKIDPTEIGRAFFTQPPHKRILITAAGPILNIALALLIAPLIYMLGIEEPLYLKFKPVIHAVLEDSSGAKAGLLKGDEIVSFDGASVANWERLHEMIALNPGKTVNLKVLRDGNTIDVQMTIGKDPENDSGDAGIEPAGTNIIGSFSKDSSAQAAGVLLGDAIVGINGAKIESFRQIVEAVSTSKGAELKIDIMRGATAMTYNITPVFNKDADAYLIGVSPYSFVRYPFGKSVKEGTFFLYNQIALAGKAIKKLMTGQMGRKALGGPVQIGSLVGMMARRGITSLIKITAVISVWLGCLNLFPFPALDGGHILFATMELVSRRKLNQKVMDVLNQVGFAMLMALIVLVSIQDVIRLFYK